MKNNIFKNSKENITEKYNSILKDMYSMYKEVKPSVKNTYKIDKIKIK